MITSITNTKIKYVRRLQAERRFRWREHYFVVEGARWVRDLALMRVEPKWIFFSEQDAPSTQALRVTPTVMAHMSAVETPPGVLAVVPIPKLEFPVRPNSLLILDRIQTPGNLGTMLRTAAAAGVEGVILTPGCVDAYNPKVVRGAMGAHLRLPIIQMDWAAITQITEDMAVWVAVIDGTTNYIAVDWQQRSALIIGNEAQGAGTAARALGTGVRIHVSAETESLNAAMAASIILFEAARQRGLQQ